MATISRAVFIFFAAMIIPAISGATALTFNGSSSAYPDLFSQAIFDTSENTLLVTLTNTSSADVANPSQVLTAVFFTAAGDPSLSPGSATLNSSTVFFGPDGGGNVGGEWAYANNLIGAPHGADEGISASGFDLFGNGNFTGLNLQDPNAVNGLNYGLTSAGDDTTTGNTAVTGGTSEKPVALIQNSVIFTLFGIPAGFDPQTAISNISFQYGTSLSEPNIVPEPGTLLLLGTGLVGVAAWGRKKYLKKTA